LLIRLRQEREVCAVSFHRTYLGVIPAHKMVPPCRRNCQPRGFRRERKLYPCQISEVFITESNPDRSPQDALFQLKYVIMGVKHKFLRIWRLSYLFCFQFIWIN